MHSSDLTGSHPINLLLTLNHLPHCLLALLLHFFLNCWEKMFINVHMPQEMTSPSHLSNSLVCLVFVSFL